MIKIKNTLTNYEKLPIGLTEIPRFSWTIESDTCVLQESFRFVAATSAEKLNTSPDVFDSGEIKSSDMAYYNKNLPLESFTRYFWRITVRVCGEIKAISSTPNEFVTASLKRSCWTPLTFKKFGVMDLCMERKEFTLNSKELEKAYLFVASTGEKSNGYMVYINGTRVGENLIAPGPTEYMTMLLSGFDVTPLLRDKNIINLDHLSGISLLLKIINKNGETAKIESDESWVAYAGDSPYTLGYMNNYSPTRHHGKYEFFNSHILLDDWYKQGADLSKFKTTPPTGTFWGPLNIRCSGTVNKICETLKPVSITKTDIGYIADFGKIQSGFLKITLKNCNPNQKITIQYAEKSENGKVCTEQYGNEYLPINEYLPSGKALETFYPKFMHTSFRYVLISGLNYMPETEDLTACFVCSDLKETAHFESDCEELNYLEKCIKRSYKSNLINIPTDCPGRERRGWTADSYAAIDSQCFMFDLYNFYDRWMNDLRDVQRIGGWCCVEYPDSSDSCTDLNWPMHIMIDPWHVYMHFGDKRILEKTIDCMEKYDDLLYDLSDNCLFSENLFSYGDWYAIERASGAFIGAAQFYYVTNLLVKAERILGFSEKVKKYESRGKEILKAVNRAYLHEQGEKVYYEENTQTANTLALAFGICPTDKREAVFHSLVSDIESRNTLGVGVVANMWIYLLLSEFDRNDLAFRLLTDPSVRGASLLNMANRLKNETLNESFENTRDSLNHAFLGGGAASWMYRSLMGICHETAGFSSFDLKPYFPASMNSLNMSLDTPHGSVSLVWSRSGSTLNITVTAPDECRRFIYENKIYNLKKGENVFTF